VKHRNTPPHGYELAHEDATLLRGAPPERALRWVESRVGRGARAIKVRALDGGTSSAIHAVDVRTLSGPISRLVLRRFVRADWLAEEPDAPRREAEALRSFADAACRRRAWSRWTTRGPMRASRRYS
jgi:hypothetical protein